MKKQLPFPEKVINFIPKKKEKKTVFRCADQAAVRRSGA